MRSPRKLVVAGAVLAVAASGLALAQAVPEPHQMRSDHQPMMQGSHSMGPDHMQEMMRHHQGMPMEGHAGMHGALTPTMPG